MAQTNSSELSAQNHSMTSDDHRSGVSEQTDKTAKVTWKPFDIGTAQRLLKPLDADWKELANYLLKEKNDERIKSIDANCSTDKVGNKALNEAVLTWRRRTASDKRKWSTLCEVAGKWGDKTLEEYLNTEKLALDQEPQPVDIMNWCKQSSLRSEHWYGFATELVGQNEADAIKRNYSGGGNKKCLEDLLGTWYRTTTSQDHSWQTIVDALKSMSEAKEVLEKIYKECVV